MFLPVIPHLISLKCFLMLILICECSVSIPLASVIKLHEDLHSPRFVFSNAHVVV